jgi:hypothetical protein
MKLKVQFVNYDALDSQGYPEKTWFLFTIVFSYTMKKCGIQ